MNSAAHDACGDWIAAKFRQYGMTVTRQETTLKGFDGTSLKSTNIIASYLPEQTARLLLCAHWDSRPWADNDPDEANWKKPVLAANDGASRLPDCYRTTVCRSVSISCASMPKTGACLSGVM